MASGEVETVKGDIGTDPKDVVSRWTREIALAGAHEKAWRDRAEKIVQKYRNDKKSAEDNKDDNAAFNVLFSNTEILRGVMYQKTPSPDVRRRFLDKAPVAREASIVLQRALSFAMDSAYDFDELANGIVEDALLPGRGMAVVDYKPTMSEDGQTVVYQEVTCKHIEWDMVRISPAKRWNKVRWIAFGELLTRRDLVSQFGEEGKACTLDWSPKDEKGEEEKEEFFKRALVWKVWDKRTRKVIFISKGSPEKPLKEVEDPLGLEGFFPCPRPIYSVKTSNSMIPIPEYLQYQNQAHELEMVTERIDALTDSLRRRGVYDAAYPEIEKLAGAGDNEFIPIENFNNLVEKGGIDKALWQEDVQKTAEVLLRLYDQRDRVKQVIYEITGISDIVRGVTKANETLGAQELKARYANVRVGPRQKEVQRFLRDLLRLMGEIIGEKFTPEILSMITGRQVTPEVAQVLRSDKLRGFSIDIETDSTIQPDAMEEQKNRTEALRSVVEFMIAAVPAVQSGQIPIDAAKELLLFGLRGFKLGPQLETMLEAIGGDGNETMRPEQKPDPAMEEAKGKLQLEGQRLQQDGQTAQMNAQVKQMELAQAKELEQAKLQFAAQIKQMELADAAEQKRLDRELDMAKFERGEITKREIEFAKIDESREGRSNDIESRNQPKIEKTVGEFNESSKSFADVLAEATKAIQEASETFGSDRELVRDANGRASGSRLKRRTLN